MLYLVPTPIGNLDDMTFRAVEVLKNADVIACEDTRTSSRLLSHYNIDTPKVSYHDHNESGRTQQLLDRLKSGQDVALISDAGMPGISDPGFKLVNAAIAEGIEYTVLPGASSVLTALVGSGMPTDRFVYEGFLPHKKGRRTRIARIAERDETTVLFESPHRIVKLLRNLSELVEETREVTVCREISKKFEEYVRGSIVDVLDELDARPRVRGEIVLVVEGRARQVSRLRK